MSYNLWEHFTKIYKIKLSKFVITSLEFIREYIKDYVSSKATVKATLLPPDHCRGQKRRLTEKSKSPGPPWKICVVPASMKAAGYSESGGVQKRPVKK